MPTSVPTPKAGSQHATLVGSRGEFSPGACVEYGPAGGDTHRTVFVDPGHGGPDPGAIGFAPDGTVLQEKTLALAVGLALRRNLQRAGYHVVLSRTKDEPVARLFPSSQSNGSYSPQGVVRDLQARIDCANAAHAQLLLSIHFDSFYDPVVGGAQSTYDPSRPFSSRSKRFALLVQQSMLKDFRAHGWPVPDRGVVPDTQLSAPTLTSHGAHYGHLLELGPRDPGWLNRASRMPGALAEPLFLSRPAEAEIAQSPIGQRILARAFTQAINQYFTR
ncbi:MAG TPA: N-acetylmuramoyl-L-alanine amidase [Chloroflexota bacterium]